MIISSNSRTAIDLVDPSLTTSVATTSPVDAPETAVPGQLDEL